MPTQVITLTFNPLLENTYVVFDEESREAIIFDPGCYKTQEEQHLIKTLDKHRLNPVKLINTHCHFDHIFGNAFVKDAFGLELGIHPLEAPVLQAAPMVVEMYGMPPMTPSPPADYFLKEGETITLNETELSLLHCPGHSPGSLCFYNAEDGYVIGGDVLFEGSIGRADLPGGDLDTLLHSIMTKLMPLPGDTIVYPGHGPSTTIRKERKLNPWIRELTNN